VDLEVFFYLDHVKNLYTIQYNTTSYQISCTRLITEDIKHDKMANGPYFSAAVYISKLQTSSTA